MVDTVEVKDTRVRVRLMDIEVEMEVDTEEGVEVV